MKRFLWFCLIVSTIILIIFLSINPSIAPLWTGLHFPNNSDLGFSSRTLWDWLELFIVPITLIIGAHYLQHLEREKTILIQRELQKQDVLNRYVDKLTGFLMEETSSEQTPKYRKDISIMRILFLSTIAQLDKIRKAEALQVIYEFGLINSIDPKIDLTGVDFEEIILTSAPLTRVCIKGAYFNHANFEDSNLTGSIFIGSSFLNAHFRGAILRGTDFSYAILKGADFTNCDLRETKLDYADITGAKLRKAKLTEIQSKQLEKKPKG